MNIVHNNQRDNSVSTEKKKEKEDKRAQALRNNLKRRKIQERDRKSEEQNQKNSD